MALLSALGASLQQLIKSDCSMMGMSYDSKEMNHILTTHAPDGCKVEVKLVFKLIENILNLAFQVSSDTAQKEMENKAQQDSFIATTESISFTIDRISCEIACKGLGGTDAHQTTMYLFKRLAVYSWDAKLVLTLAAFAIKCGEFELLKQIYSKIPLAKSIAILKQPSILESEANLKSRFDALSNLIKVMMDVTRCVIEFKDLPSQYTATFTTDIPLIPTAVYLIIRSVVACTTQITSMGHKFSLSISEGRELSTLTTELKIIYENLTKKMDECKQQIAYQTLLKMVHNDNMEILKALIRDKNDLLTLFDCSTKETVKIDVLLRKNVLLLISDLNISQDEFLILKQNYTKSGQYEVVWIPVVDHYISWDKTMQNTFENIKSQMPWHTVHDPTLIEKWVIRFTKEEWHFRNKPILVVLDPEGKVVSPNAIHMMWIWGLGGTVESLWKEATWSLERLLCSIDRELLKSTGDDKYIFLYGGDDVEWVCDFITTVHTMLEFEKIHLQMVYVGKSSKTEKVQKVHAAIESEGLSSKYWSNLTMVGLFWTRLKSMLFSKIQLGRAYDRDQMMQEINKLIRYDNNGVGWALLSKGSQIVVSGQGTTVLTALKEHIKWREHNPTKEFDKSLKDRHDELYRTDRQCCKFEFQIQTHGGRIPESMMCPECQSVMKKLTTFCCCHDDNVPGTKY